MRHFVYIIGAKHHNADILTAIKIGISRSPEERLAQLQSNTFIELKLLSIESYYGKEKARNVEKKLHDKFKRFCIRGEWFKIETLQLIQELGHILNLNPNKEYTKKTRGLEYCAMEYARVTDADKRADVVRIYG